MTFAIPVLLVLVLAAIVFSRGTHRGANTVLAMRIVAACALLLLALVPPRPDERSLRNARGIALIADGSSSMRRSDRSVAAQRAVRRMSASVTSSVIAGTHTPQRTSVEALLQQWPTQATSSSVMQSVREAQHAEPPPAAVVIVTDGELDDDPRLVAQLPTPCVTVHVVTAGDAVRNDVGLGLARLDPIVYAGTSARLTAVLRARGLTQSTRVRVRALDERDVPLATREVTLPAGDHEQALTLDVLFDTPGAQRVRVVATEPDGDGVPNNNIADVGLIALRDRLRVLLLAGRPGFDLSALRRTLRANASLDLVSFYILRTNDDLTMAPQNELSLIPFPTEELFREHLHSFDAVFVHDLDPQPYGLVQHLDALARYVRGGGALALVGIDALRAESIRTGALAELLPFTPADAMPDPSAFHPLATAAGQLHPLLQDWYDDSVQLQGAARIDAVASDAVTLLEHPTLRDARGQPAPLLSVRRVGAGRTLGLATDSSWRLGVPSLATGGDPERLPLFWDRVLAWMASEAGALTVRAQGNTIEVEGAPPRTEIAITADLRDGSHRSNTLTTDAAGRALWNVQSELLAASAVVRATNEQRRSYASGPLHGDESAAVHRNGRVLDALIARCGGARHDANASLDALLRVERASLLRARWRPVQATLLALVAALLLGAEWFARRTRGAR